MNNEPLQQNVTRAKRRAWQVVFVTICCLTVLVNFLLAEVRAPDRFHAENTFRTNDLLVDKLATIGSNAAALENPNRVLSVGGPWQNVFNVGSDMSEIFLQTLKGSGHPTTSDVCGVVVRNQVTFDNTAGSNQSCGAYFETTATKIAGTAPLINYGVRGHAEGGDQNYALYCDKGAMRCDDGALLGSSAVTGSLDQQDGDVQLNFGGSAGGGSGTTSIKGDTHIISHSLVVDNTGEFGGNLTADAALRVNGNANLAGSPSSKVFVNSFDSSGLVVPFTNTLSFPVEHATGPGAADPSLELTIVTGSGTALTLANGTKDGQIKAFSMFSGTGSITPASGVAYTWTSTPASVILQWDNVNTRWVSVSITGLSAGVSPSMTIANATQSAAVNLSTTGTGQIDWLFASPTQQGNSTRVYDSFAATLETKLTGGGLLLSPGIDVIGSSGTNANSNGTVTFSSTASDTTTQTAISSASGNGITAAGVNAGLRFVAPVTTSSRVFRIYNSHSNSTWSCTAHLMDGSVSDKTTTPTVATTAVEEVQTITVTAGSDTNLVVYCVITATSGTAVIKWYAEILSLT